jgi:hypothetical protein
MKALHPTPARALLALAGLFLSSICLICPAQAASPADKVLGQAGKALSIRQETQRLVDSQAPHIDKLKDRIEFLEDELKQLLRQRVKTTAYLNDQRDKVSALKRRLAEMEIIRRELEPFMDETWDRISNKLRQDLPFAVPERSVRLKRLKDKLDDFDAGLADKARALLETLGVEAGYGLGVEVTESEVDLAGRAQRVKLFRLGRLGLFALSPEGDKAWSLEPHKGKWQAVHQSARQLNLAAEIAQRQRVVSLVELPLPKPQNAADPVSVSGGQDPVRGQTVPLDATAGRPPGSGDKLVQSAAKEEVKP